MSTVELRDGRAVLVREGGDALRHEAAVLEALRGPGIPEVLAVDDDGERVRLVTALEPPLLLEGVDVAGVVAEVAGVLARAHAVGLVHGPLREEHLHGRPGAVLVTGWHDAGPGDPAADVAELGRFVERRAGGDPVLGALAARALAPEPPTMAALAAASPRPVAGTVPARWLPLRPAAAAVVAIAVVGLVGVGAASFAGPRDAVPRPAATDPASPSSTSSTTARSPDHGWRVVGNVLERDGERWALGRAGDVVVVGDWRCSGRAAAALLRPATGQVWVFDRWARSGEEVTGTVRDVVPGAVALLVEPGARCDRLVAVDAQGTATAVG